MRQKAEYKKDNAFNSSENPLKNTPWPNTNV